MCKAKYFPARIAYIYRQVHGEETRSVARKHQHISTTTVPDRADILFLLREQILSSVWPYVKHLGMVH